VERGVKAVCPLPSGWCQLLTWRWAGGMRCIFLNVARGQLARPAGLQPEALHGLHRQRIHGIYWLEARIPCDAHQSPNDTRFNAMAALGAPTWRASLHHPRRVAVGRRSRSD
jgi:hypothetical protein